MASYDMNQISSDSLSTLQNSLHAENFQMEVPVNSVNSMNATQIGEEMLRHNHITSSNHIGSINTYGSVFSSYYGNHDKFGYRNQADENMRIAYQMATKKNKSIFELLGFVNKTNTPAKTQSAAAAGSVFASSQKRNFYNE